MRHIVILEKINDVGPCLSPPPSSIELLTISVFKETHIKNMAGDDAW